MSRTGWEAFRGSNKCHVSGVKVRTSVIYLICRRLEGRSIVIYYANDHTYG